jgi:putative hydrolase of the HAD superfamily
MVGDWPERDVVGAAKANIRTVFARYGDTFGTVDSGADYEIDDIQELIGIVNDLNTAKREGAKANP